MTADLWALAADPAWRQQVMLAMIEAYSAAPVAPSALERGMVAAINSAIAKGFKSGPVRV